MEAVPRLPMISFHLKVSPEAAVFGPKLKQYIRDFYNEDPESYANEIHQLESLRASAVRPPIDMAGCLLLKKYYCQLHFLQSRFPMGKDGTAAITFTWRDTYANMVCSLANIRFEIISILYNIGAMHTLLGAHIERSTADGMKMACAHFQCAAWAFEHLKNSYPQPSGIDLAPELMTFMHQLCLAQAQECILEKSMLDNRKPTIVAKVAKQIVDYFALALNTLEQGGCEDGTVSDTVGTKIYKSWKRYVNFKKAYHLSVTYLYQGLAAEEQRKMGERVAFYNAALVSLSEAYAIYVNAKGYIGITGALEEKTIVEEALTFTNDVIKGKRKAAKNENEFIYHEEVPEKEALPTVKGASLVKGISFSINDPEVSGPDIFARLVPMKVHEASSLYSEEKAKILRSIGSKIEEKDDQLMTYLASLKLDHLSLWDPDVQTSEWERLPLPDELVERCAALNAKLNVIQDLLNVMGKLSNISQDVETVLKEIKKLLSEEELKEKQYQDAVGKRPPTIVATDLTREAKKYEEAHDKASESNQALHKAITMHVKNLKVLAQPLADLVAHIPSPSTYFTDQNNDEIPSARELDKTHVKELKRILNKVDEMRRQRNDLHAKLRDSITQDDLTRLLVTATSDSGSLDHLFADQLNKHQALVSLIEQNLAAQDNILAALTDAYAQTADIRKGIEEILKRRELTIASLITSYDTYEDLLAKSSKGLEFYRKLEINVSKLLQRVKSTCKVQDEEREQILAQDSKNTTEKVDGSPPTSGQSTTRNSSVLKLKDYLNNRAEGITTAHNQYYGLTKGHTDQYQVDSLTATKAFPGDQEVNLQLPSAFSTNESTGCVMNSTPQFYSTYMDPPAYQYAAQVYGESLRNVDNALSTNYNIGTSGNMEFSITNRRSNAPAAPLVPTALAMQYPNRTYMPSEQTLPMTILDEQGKYSSAHQSHYSDMQYNIYQQPTVDYNRQQQGIVERQEHNYNVINHCNANQENVTVPKVQTDNADLSSQFQSMSLSTPAATVGVAVINTAVTPDQHTMVQQQYIPDTQDVTGVVQDTNCTVQSGILSQRVSLPTSTAIQSYSIASQMNNVAYPQKYINTGYFGDGTNKQSQQQVLPNQSIQSNSTSTQYLQLQGTNTTVYSTHATTASTNDISSTVATSAQSSMTHYTQQQNNYVDPSKQQTYGNETCLPYGAQINNTVRDYSSTYQTYHPGTSGVQYQQSTSGISTNYPCTSSSDAEIIQSHAKSQSYQYPHHGHYLGYIQGSAYSQGYSHDYGYTMDQYKTQQGYSYDANQTASGYLYNSNDQTSDVTSFGAYQQEGRNAQYTNASNNVIVSQTSSSQYPSQVYQEQGSSETYYSTPYGLQMQGQGSIARNENQNNYSQTYMQAVNNGTNTTTSSYPVTFTTKSEEKSNVDLLSDLDVTINHAPMVPEVRPLNKASKEDSSSSSSSLTMNTSVEQSKETEETKKPENIVVAEDKEEYDSLQIVWDTWYTDVQPKKDPLGDPTTLQKFVNDVEKYEKFVYSLLVRTLSGATNLDIKWKELQDFEERENRIQSDTASHLSKHQIKDSVSYVQVSLHAGTTYKNVPCITKLTQCMPTTFIIMQTPSPDKFDAFWKVIWEHESEVIACLASDAQMNNEIYWPATEENDLSTGKFVISLKKMVNHPFYTQRLLSVRHLAKESERMIVHMQFLRWPSNAFPSSPGALLGFSTDVLTEQALRRCSAKPIVVHCLDGASLSSLFLVAVATVCHIRAGRGIVDIPFVFKGLIKCGKEVVDKETLLFAYRMVLYHAQDILMKRGILSSRRCTFENFESLKGIKDKASKKLHLHPSDDFLHNFGTSVSHSGTEQYDNLQMTSGSTKTTHISTQEKTNASIVDPLSQLDPLWSIRR